MTTHAELVAVVEKAHRDTAQRCLDLGHHYDCRCQFERNARMDTLAAMLEEAAAWNAIPIPTAGDIAERLREIVADALRKMGCLAEVSLSADMTLVEREHGGIGVSPFVVMSESRAADLGDTMTNSGDIKAVVDATHQWGEPLTEAEAIQILDAISDRIAARALREAVIALTEQMDEIRESPHGTMDGLLSPTPAAGLSVAVVWLMATLGEIEGRDDDSAPVSRED